MTIPVLQDMELAATNTAEVVAKHMQLSEEKTAEISMALIEATINAFEHSEAESSNVEIHFIIEGDILVIKVTDQGKGFDKSKRSKSQILKINFHRIIKEGGDLN